MEFKLVINSDLAKRALLLFTGKLYTDEELQELAKKEINLDVIQKDDEQQALQMAMGMLAFTLI